MANIKPIIQSQAIHDQLFAIKDEIVELSQNLDYRQRRDIMKTLNDIIDKDNEELKKKIKDMKPFIFKLIKTRIPNFVA